MLACAFSDQYTALAHWREHNPALKVARLVARRGSVRRPHRRAHLVDVASVAERGSWAVRAAACNKKRISAKSVKMT